jgi:hypothetical protein
MSDQPQKPPRTSRWTIWLILLFLAAILIPMAQFRNYSPGYRSWGDLLSDIKEGHVLRVVIADDEVEVTAKGNCETKEVQYNVDYPGGFINETVLKELHDSIQDYNDHITRADQFPIMEKGVPAKGVVIQVMPWFLLSMLCLAVYVAVLRYFPGPGDLAHPGPGTYHKSRMFLRFFRVLAWVLAMSLGMVLCATTPPAIVLGLFLGGLAHALTTGVLAVLAIAEHTDRMRFLMEQERDEKAIAARNDAVAAAGAAASLGERDPGPATGPAPAG